MKHILLSLLLIATPISTNGNAIVKQQLVNNKQSISIDKAETQVKEFIKSISSQLTRTQLNAYENEI